MMATLPRGRPRGGGRRAIPAALLGVLLVVGLAGCGASSAAGQAHAPTATMARTPTVTLPHSGAPSFPVQWTPSVTAAPLLDIAFAPSAPETGYACAVTYGAPPPEGFAPVYVTHNAGKTWMPIRTLSTGAGLSCTVFVDQADANDVFVQTFVPAPSGAPGQTWLVLMRSVDGGATWRKLAPRLTQQGPSPWTNVAVFGARIIATAGAINPGEGGQPPLHDLFASDDGGATWAPIGQSIADGGTQIGPMFVMGQTLFVQTESCAGNCPNGLAAPVFATRLGEAPLSHTLSSLRPAYGYWRTDNGGATWAKVSMPLPYMSELRITRKATGPGYFGVAYAEFVDGGDLTRTALLQSSDSGATWTRLPDLNGDALGYGDARSVGGSDGLAVTPDGTVLASFWASWQDANSGVACAGIVELRAGQTTWQPLAPGGVQQWQLQPLAAGPRLWAYAVENGALVLVSAPVI